MSTRARLFLVSVLLSSTAVAVAEKSGAGAAGLTYPAMNTDPNLATMSQDFPVCTTDDQEFCIESFWITPVGGEARKIADPVVPIMQRTAGPDPTVNAFFAGEYKGPTSTSVNGFLPSLAVNFSDTGFNKLPTETTADGLRDAKYRTVIRVGDFDPSYLLLTGKYESYTYEKGADGYYTIDLTLSPTKYAGVVDINGDTSVRTACEASKWLGECESNQAYRRYAMVTFMMMPTAEMRNTMRGTWISTNASTFSLNPPDLTTGEMKITASGPHYVPADFGDTSLKLENTRYLNPGFFEMYLSFGAVAQIMSMVSGKPVTADQAKTFLSKPTEVLEGTIKDAASAGATPVDKVQSLTTTVGASGVRVDFGIEHFSAPNPTLKIKAPAALTAPATTTTVPATTTTTTTTTVPAPVVAPVAATTPARSSRTLSNGAKLSIATSATKGRVVTARSLLSPSSGASISRVTSRSTKICTVKGTSVRMLKAGTCRLTATVSAKKKSSSVSFNVSVS